MVIEALQQVLKDKDASVRRIAVGILEEIGNESAVAILRQILEDGDFFVREKANSALKRIPIRVAGTVLRKALKKGDPSVRRKITRILEDAHNGGSVADSSEILQHVDSFSNLATASKAMSIEEAIATLQQALKDPDPSIHECAREVVSDIANPLLNDLSVAIATLESNIDYVDNAATALQNFGDPELLPHLSNISLFSAIAGSDVIFDVISGIQNRCGFYNYKIVQSSLLEKEKKPESLVDILKEIRQTLENASKAPKYDFRYANINNLSDTFSGVWNEYNYNQEQKRDLAVLVAEIQELFKKMVQNYLTITEDEKPAIVVHLVEKLDILVNSINKFEE